MILWESARGAIFGPRFFWRGAWRGKYLLVDIELRRRFETSTLSGAKIAPCPDMARSFKDRLMHVLTRRSLLRRRWSAFWRSFTWAGHRLTESFVHLLSFSNGFQLSLGDLDVDRIFIHIWLRRSRPLRSESIDADWKTSFSLEAAFFELSFFMDNVSDAHKATSTSLKHQIHLLRGRAWMHDSLSCATLTGNSLALTLLILKILIRQASSPWSRCELDKLMTPLRITMAALTSSRRSFALLFAKDSHRVFTVDTFLHQIVFIVDEAADRDDLGVAHDAFTASNHFLGQFTRQMLEIIAVSLSWLDTQGAERDTATLFNHCTGLSILLQWHSRAFLMYVDVDWVVTGFWKDSVIRHTVTNCHQSLLLVCFAPIDGSVFCFFVFEDLNAPLLSSHTVEAKEDDQSHSHEEKNSQNYDGDWVCLLFLNFDGDWDFFNDLHDADIWLFRFRLCINTIFGDALSVENYRSKWAQPLKLPATKESNWSLSLVTEPDHLLLKLTGCIPRYGRAKSVRTFCVSYCETLNTLVFEHQHGKIQDGAPDGYSFAVAILEANHIELVLIFFVLFRTKGELDCLDQRTRTLLGKSADADTFYLE